MVFNITFNNISDIMAVSFICGLNRSTRRKPQTSRKSLKNFIIYRVHTAMSGIPTHNVSGDTVATICIGSCKSNYHI